MKIESSEYKGFNIEIHTDEFPSNPRGEFDNLGIMIFLHKRYNLGDKHNYKKSHFSSWGELLGTLKTDEGKGIYIPVYMLDHSGIWLRAGGTFSDVDPGNWDSGMIGYAFITNKAIKEEYGDLSKESLERAKGVLLAEVKEYSSYLNGEVYGYSVKNKAGEELDSCWGFIGDFEYCKEEAKRWVDVHLEDHKETSITMRPVFIWDCPVCKFEHREIDPVGQVTCEHCGHVYEVEGNE